MVNRRTSRVHTLLRLSWSCLACVLLAAPVAPRAQGIPYTTPVLEHFHPLDETGPRQNPFGVDAPAVLKLKTTLFRDTTIIDFEKRQISFIRSDRHMGLTVWEYHYDELDEYLAGRQRFTLAMQWHASHIPQSSKTKKSDNLPSLDFIMPVNCPAWARRVLGREPPRLTIKGYQAITIALNKYKREVGGQPVKDGQVDQWHPNFEQDNSFNIRGSIGRLINVQIKAGKDEQMGDLRDQLKDFKIEYKEDSIGELEDEVIQEVIAGVTNFAMPGTDLSGYSESHEGLFGIKVKSKLGPLMLTTIASHEKGEVQKDTLDLSLGGGSDKSIIDEKSYTQNRYFFLDSLYLLKYLNRAPPGSAVPKVSDLRIYRWLNPTKQRTDVTRRYVTARYGDTRQYQLGNFIQLKEYDQYYLNREEGWIRFLDSVMIDDDDLIGIFMRTDNDDAILPKGDTGLVDDTVLTNLWVLKNKMPQATDSTFHLMWRNVYKISGNPSPEKFDITIRRKDVPDSTFRFNGRLFTEILGLSDNRGKPFKDLAAENANGIEKIYDFVNGYVIIPPFINDTVPGNWPFANPSLGTTDLLPNTNPAIYTTPRSNYADWQDKVKPLYEITLFGASEQKTVFSLGWNITPNTEVVKMNKSIVLKQNVDYTIDYESGVLELISGQARSAKSIEVEYQREAMFMFDRKAFVGMHGKIDLPGIGRDSYLASSILFQSTSAGRKVPRINQIPFNKLLIGANTKLDFEPEWMTKAVNLLPLVKTDATSSLTLNAEIAHSSMLPNSGSQAYIENFEQSMQIYDLGVSSHSRWFKSSPPADILLADSLLWRPPAWDFYWYSTEGNDRLSRDAIWYLTDEERNRPREELLTRTLRLTTQAAPKNELVPHYKNPWAGIMTTIPVSQADRTDDRYLEIWLKDPGDGVLYIDMGNLSEDVSHDGGLPDKRWNAEDPDLAYGTPDDSLDRGLDGLWDKDEIYKVPDFTNPAQPVWRTLFYGDSLLDRFIHDPSRDNWRGNYRYDSLGNKTSANGTQGDRVNQSEDINDDGWNTAEDFFRVRVNLANINLSRFIDRSVSSKPGWYHLRIPLNDTTVLEKIHGTPRWSHITFVRLWWSDIVLKQETRTLEFAALQFVGNQWRPHRTGDSLKAGYKIEATQLSNKENREYYRPPRPVQQQLNYEQADNEAPLEEHALRLNYHNLLPGEAAYVERHLSSYQEVNLSAFSELRMYVKDQYRLDPSTWFFFRFGLNDSTYYEYRTRNLSSTWDNGLVIDLRTFSQLKLSYLEKSFSGRDNFDTSAVLAGGSIYRIFSTTKVPPTFSKVQWMALGMLRDDNAFGTDTGEIWVDDIGITKLQPLSGMALRSNISSRWADFMDLAAGLNYNDADFRRMSESSLNPGQSDISGSLTAQWTLNKFLPQDLGISVPLSASVTSQLSRPKVRPETDIYLTDKENDQADGLRQMAGDFVDQVLNTRISKERTESEYYERESVTRSWSTGYSKNSISENPLVNLTADRISIDGRYSRDSTVTGRGRHPDPQQVAYEDIDSRKSYSGSLNYNLSPRKPAEWTRWKPFSRSTNKKFMPQLKEYELTFLPKTFNLKLANASYSRSLHYEGRRPENNTQSKQLGINHGLQFAFEPIRPLVEMTYNVDVSRNFDRDTTAMDSSVSYLLKERIFRMDPEWGRYLLSRGEQSRTQQAMLQLKPDLFDWLSNDASYRASYTHRPQELRNDFTRYLSANVTTTVNMRSTLRLRNLISNAVDASAKRKTVNGLFDAMDKALGKINLRDFQFNYEATSTLNNEYLSTRQLGDRNVWASDYMGYQLGFKDRSLVDVVTGSMDDDHAFGGMRTRNSVHEDSLKLWINDRREGRQGWSIKTDLRLPDPFDLNFNELSLSWSRKYTVKPTYYTVNSKFIDTSYTFPQIRVGMSSGILQKIPFVKEQMRSVRMSSSFDYNHTLNISSGSASYEAKVDESEEFGLNPLVGLNGTIKKWPIDLSYRHTFKYAPRSSAYRGSTSAADRQNELTRSHGNSWTLNYKTYASRLKEIKILRWKLPVKGELTVGVEANHQHDKTENKTQAIKVTDLTTFQINPHASYYFTSNVQGKAEYLGRQTSDRIKSEDKETEHAFSLTVRIDF